MSKRQFWIFFDCVAAGFFITAACRLDLWVAAFAAAMAGGFVGLVIVWIVEPFKRKNQPL